MKTPVVDKGLMIKRYQVEIYGLPIIKDNWQ